MTVEPAKVRLTNTAKECYSWSYRPEVAHLFSRNLSDHRLSAYEDLCSEVGVSFEAITPFGANGSIAVQTDAAAPQLRAILPQQPHHDRHSAAKTVEAKKSRGERETFLQEMMQLQERLDAEEAGKRRLEQELEAARAECGRLTRECTETAERFIASETLLCKCLHTLESIPTSVAELREEISEAIGQNAFAAC